MVLNSRLTLDDAKAVVESGKKYPHINYTLMLLEQCLDTYSGEEIFLSFNGGKDCTAVLHLAASICMLREISPLTCLYVTEDSFPEVDDFVNQAAQYYNIKLVKKKKPMKTALIEFLAENKKLKACLMGVRRGDPGSDNLEPFMYTDSGWPKLMRVSLILDWTYNEVWQFLLEHKVPYCSLYDKGYTSLGERTKTFPNPLLKNPSDPSQYFPAYALVDDSTERDGRR